MKYVVKCQYLATLLVAIQSIVFAGSISESQIAPYSVRLETPEQNTVLYNPTRNEYSFIYQKDEERVEFSILLRDSFIDRGMISSRVRIDERKVLIPIKECGLLVRSATGEIFSPSDIAAHGNIKLVSHALENNQVNFIFEDDIAGRTLRKEYRYAIKGKTLIINASASTVANATAGYIGFDFGNTLYTPNSKLLRLPSSSVPVLAIDDEFFMSSYVDPAVSSTARYEKTHEVITQRLAQASNTPAWLIEDGLGELPALNVTAYITISDELLDVLPVPVSPQQTGESLSGDTVFFDLHEYPFAQRPYMPLELVRRWEVPTSGVMSINGAFSLLEGNENSIEVRLERREDGKEFVLYSQTLTRDAKPVTGIKGDFPVSAGDQLLLVSTSPAVVSGGKTGINVLISLNEESYSTTGDFQQTQGYRGWYYEQKYGNRTSLLIWNDNHKRWESPETRAWITDTITVNQRGSVDDAFQSAQLFFDELDTMGMGSFYFILNGWHNHARIPGSASQTVDTWGSAESLHNLTQALLERGNQVAPIISYTETKADVKQKAKSMFSLDALTNAMVNPKDIYQQYSELLEKHFSQIRSRMAFNGILTDDVPHHEGVYRYLSFARLFDSNTADLPFLEYAKTRILREKSTGKIPAFLKVNSNTGLMGGYWQQFFNGVIEPPNPMSNLSNYVDFDLLVGKAGNQRIGVGDPAAFFQLTAGERVDPRVNPLDQYLTSTVLLGRIPLLTDNIYHTSFDSKQFRKLLLESYSLLQPAAKEYRGHLDTPVNIEYVTTDENTIAGNRLAFEDNPEEFTKIAVSYESGLQIYANRSGNSWNLEHTPFTSAKIARDGFLAKNDNSGFVSMIGEVAGRSFSIAKTPETTFLHSRDGIIISIPPFTTDGMVKVWDSPFPGRKNMVCLSTTDLSVGTELTPLLRTNYPIDLSLNWTSQNTAKLWLLDEIAHDTMLEIYTLPPEWVHEKRMTIHHSWENDEDSTEEITWTKVQSGGHTGIRLLKLYGNSVYTIQMSIDTET